MTEEVTNLRRLRITLKVIGLGMYTPYKLQSDSQTTSEGLNSTVELHCLDCAIAYSTRTFMRNGLFYTFV